MDLHSTHEITRGWTSDVHLHDHMTSNLSTSIDFWVFRHRDFLATVRIRGQFNRIKEL